MLTRKFLETELKYARTFADYARLNALVQDHLEALGVEKDWDGCEEWNGMAILLDRIVQLQGKLRAISRELHAFGVPWDEVTRNGEGV